MLSTLRKLLSATTTGNSIERTAKLNDDFRARPHATPNGRVLFSPGVMALAREPNTPTGLAEAMLHQAHLLGLVRDAFQEPMFDPRDTRAAGTVQYLDRTIEFRIEYLARDLIRPARDPADADNTVRVMVLSLPGEENPYRLALMLPPAPLARDPRR